MNKIPQTIHTWYQTLMKKGPLLDHKRPILKDEDRAPMVGAIEQTAIIK